MIPKHKPLLTIAKFTVAGIKEAANDVEKFNANLLESDKILIGIVDKSKTLGDEFSKAPGFKDFVRIMREIKKLYEETNSETEKRRKIVSDLERAELQLKKAQSQEAVEVQKLRVETQELNKANKAAAKEALGMVNTYQRFVKETRQAKNDAKNLGAEMLDLENKFKRGEISAKSYNAEMNRLSREFTEAKLKALGLDDQLKKLDSSVGDHQRSVGHYEKAITGISGAFRGALAAFGVVGAMQMFAELSRSSYDTVKQLNAQQYALNEVFKSEAQVAYQQEFLSGISEKYGLNILTTTDAYTKYAAALRDTYLEGEKGRMIFEAFSGASAKLALSADQQAGIFKALEQMISKGKIQAEELRGQLGDRMAGSFKLFADGLGVSTAELDKMLKAGEVISDDVLPKVAERLSEVYNLNTVAKIDTMVAAQNRFKNVWTDFLNELAGNDDVMTGLADGLDSVATVVEFLLDTFIVKGADGVSVMGDLTDIITILFETVGDLAENLGFLDEKQKSNLFSMRQFKNDLTGMKSVVDVVAGAIVYLAETIGNLFKLSDGFDAWVKRMEASADRLIGKWNRAKQLEKELKDANERDIVLDDVDQEAKRFKAAWESAKKARDTYFQFNGKYYNSATGKNTGKSVDDYIDVVYEGGTKLERKNKPDKTPPAAGSGVNKAAKEAEKRQRTAQRDADRAEKEAERRRRENFQKEKKQLDDEFKIYQDSIKKRRDFIKNSDFLQEEEKLKKLDESFTEEQKEVERHYKALDAIAIKYLQDERFATDLALKTSDISHSKTLNIQGLTGAKLKDLEYLSRKLQATKDLTYEERRQSIIADDRISKRLKEQVLDALELENKIDINKGEIEKLESTNAILKASEQTLAVVQQIKDNEVAIARLKNENAQLEIESTEHALQKHRDWLSSIREIVSNGFEDMGLDEMALGFRTTFDAILSDEEAFADKFGEGISRTTATIIGGVQMALGALSALSDMQTQKTMAALDMQLEASRSATDQELDFIESRLEWLNNLQSATADQIEERNALEDEARVIREQQLQREQAIEAQKARAQQRAAANQAIINGLLAATTTLAQLGIPLGIIPAAIAASFGVVQAGLIMAQDPVPRYFIGREDGPAEWAYTQEKGREIITDKQGNIKDLGHDKGPKLTWLEKGDKVYTALETEKYLKNIIRTPKIGQKLMDGLEGSSTFIMNSDIDYDKMADKVGDRFERSLKKYSNATTFEDEDGNVYLQEPGKIPVLRGKKRVKKQNVEIKIKDRNVRD